MKTELWACPTKKLNDFSTARKYEGGRTVCIDETRRAAWRKVEALRCAVHDGKVSWCRHVDTWAAQQKANLSVLPQKIDRRNWLIRPLFWFTVCTVVGPAVKQEAHRFPFYLFPSKLLMMKRSCWEG
mmetsp:Transcript_29728/g.58356  ORF Transcript_29728/g.58356 Transcript_29728/m.58356 type:complete len:127 (-) Transcript_29728:310-690(-)